MKLLFIVALSTLLTISAKADYVNKFIIDYLRCRNIYAATFLICGSNDDIKYTDALETFKALNGAGIRINIFTPNHCLSPNLCSLRKVPIRTMVILDISCKGSLSLFKQEYRHWNKWLLLDIKNNSWQKHWSEDLDIKMSSDVTLAIGNKNNSITLFDVYDPGVGVKQRAIRSGVWSLGDTNSGCNLISTASIYEKRRNMTGVIVRAVFLLNKKITVPLNEYFKDRRNKNEDTIGKFNFELFENIVEEYNFTPIFLTTDQWFVKTKSGNDPEIIELLDKGQADVGCCTGITDTSKVDVVDTVALTYPSRMFFIFRNPRLHGTIRNEILKPFTFEAWCATLVLLVILSVVLKFTYKIEKLIHRTRLNISTMTVFLVSISAICQQGLIVFPLYGAGRITVLTVLFSSFLVYNFYTSSIVSSLIVDVPSPFKNVREFAESDLSIGLESLKYISPFLNLNNDSDVDYLYKTKIAPLHGKGAEYYGQEEGIERVRRGGFAYHTEASIAYSIIDKTFNPIEICELEELKMIKPFMLSVMTKKNSEYKKLFQIR